jgi:Ion channel
MTRGRAGRAQAVVRGETAAQYSFGIVLVLILTVLIFQIAAPEGDGSRFVTVVLHGAALMAALWASHTHRHIVRLAGLAVTVAIVGSGAALAGSGEFEAAPAAIVNLLFVALTPAAVTSGLIRELRAERVVDVRTMLGVLCIYLLVGSFFAFLFGLLDAVQDPSFFRQQVDAAPSDFLYYSFTTITTLGYGDLTTASELGRSLTIAEALIGQIYLVTVVALIVANLGRGRRGQRA